MLLKKILKTKKILNRKKVNPGLPEFTGVKYQDEIALQLYQYNEHELSEKENFDFGKFEGFGEADQTSWMNIHGIHDVVQITKICQTLGVHNLTIQDILDVNQRPKFQEFDEYWFFAIKSIVPSKNSLYQTEQLSFLLGSNFLVSFQEKRADYFDHIRSRLRGKIGISRERGPDFLLFLLLESILDNYFQTVSKIESKVEDLALIDFDADPSPATLTKIESYKRRIHKIKKTIIPIKSFVTQMERRSFKFIEARHTKYYYELVDLCLSLIDECEQLEVRLESSVNLFFSVQSHRMNQVMKTLTVVTAIFIPLTFIAGVYGMNFTDMPELSWKWGYPAVWGVMLTIFLVLLGFFKKKKWF